jgi:hypothetical protein
MNRADPRILLCVVLIVFLTCCGCIGTEDGDDSYGMGSWGHGNSHRRDHSSDHDRDRDRDDH